MHAKSKLLFLFFFLFPNLAYGTDATVRVHVFSRHSLEEIEIISNQTFPIHFDEQGEVLWPAEKKLPIGVQKKSLRLPPSFPQKLARLKLSRAPGRFWKIRTPAGLIRFFSGSLQIEIRKGKLHLMETIPIEKYVATVLASELPQNFPLETLKAQAVLIRTQARHNPKPHHREGFDFCDTTHCQVYHPQRQLAEPARAASAQTQAWILTYHTKPIAALYHSTCGGHTQANHQVFGGRPLPYLQGVDDQNHCQASPHAQWQSNLSLSEIEAALQHASEITPVRGLKNISQKNGQVVLMGEQVWQLNFETFRLLLGRHLGWSQVKSNRFKIQVKDDKATFTGQGLGHGVGLCQWGARDLAQQDKNFREILAHYFPGTRLQRMQK